MVFLDYDGLGRRRQVYWDSVYDLYERPTAAETARLDAGHNPWQGTRDEFQETLDCEDVQRFLVWCAYNKRPFKLRYASAGASRRSDVREVTAKVYLNVKRYPNIHRRGRFAPVNGDNPFVFTHRNNNNVWCLVAYIKETIPRVGDIYRWITAREYNDSGIRRFPRVVGVNDNFFNTNVLGNDSKRDCLDEVVIDEESLEDPPPEDSEPGGEEPEDNEPGGEEPENPPPRPRSPIGTRSRLRGPAQGTRSKTLGKRD